MPRVTLQQTNFTAGELSPRMIGRTDVDRYANGAALVQNAYPVVHGGAVRRPGTFYIAPALVTPPFAYGHSRLIPFIAGRDQAWMVEFGNLEARIMASDGTLVATLAITPYNSQFLDRLDYAQSDSTMYLFFPYAPVHRLARSLDGAWTLDPVPFTQLPFDEVGFWPGYLGTLSATTVGVGRTLTSASAVFLASDVGRAVTQFSGIAVITGYTSATQVTVEITRAFASTSLPSWRIDSSPQTSCTPSAKDPVGATITLTLAADGWRAGDVGSMVRINGGLCKITAYTSALIVDAKIVRVLEGITAAPALAWSLESPVWSAAAGYPRTGTIYQQRLIAGGTTFKPRTVWGSRIGEPLDFEMGLDDDLAFSKTIDSDEASPIAYITSDSDLLILTESAEYSLRPPTGQALTALSGQIRPEGNAGCAQVRPVTVRQETVFLQRAARKARSLGYRYENDRYNSADLTRLAEHITASGVADMAYQQEPDSVLWAVRRDGTILSCTIERDEGVLGWARHYTNGAFEAVAVMPVDGRDQVWLAMRRYINGAVVRTIEVMDASWEPQLPGTPPAASEFPPYESAVVYGCTLDCALSFDNASGQTVFSVPHLIGAEVDIVADGSVMPRQTVPPSGNVTIDRPSYRTLIGLPFSTKITPLTPELGGNVGTAQGSNMRTAEVTLRLLNTVGCTLQDDEGHQQVIPFRRLAPGVLDQPPEVKSQLVPVELLGWQKGRNTFSIIQDQPLPLHVLAVIRKFTAND